MKNLFYRLILYLDTASENDTYYAIALYMANNFNNISKMRINELAQACFVSPATISRFCRALGYENYSHLKQECYRFHHGDKRYTNIIKVPLELMKSNPQEATKQHIKQIQEGLTLLENLDWDSIDHSLKLIHDSNKVAFFGTQFSQSAALHFQIDLLMLEKYTICTMDSAKQERSAKSLDASSTAIIISVNGYFVDGFHKIMQYIKKSKCKVILITANKNINLNINIDYTIYLSDHNISKTGKHNLLALMELMSLRYYSIYYPSLHELQKKII